MFDNFTRLVCSITWLQVRYPALEGVTNSVKRLEAVSALVAMASWLWTIATTATWKNS